VPQYLIGCSGFQMRVSQRISRCCRKKLCPSCLSVKLRNSGNDVSTKAFAILADRRHESHQSQISHFVVLEYAFYCWSLKRRFTNSGNASSCRSIADPLLSTQFNLSEIHQLPGSPCDGYNGNAKARLSGIRSFFRKRKILFIRLAQGTLMPVELKICCETRFAVFA